MNRLTALFQSFARNESGATAIEYSMLLLLVVIGIVAANEQIGAALQSFFDAAAAGFT